MYRNYFKNTIFDPRYVVFGRNLDQSMIADVSFGLSSFSCSILRLTLSIMPSAKQVNNNDDPPKLMIGRGCPVTGPKVDDTFILTIA